MKFSGNLVAWIRFIFEITSMVGQCLYSINLKKYLHTNQIIELDSECIVTRVLNYSNNSSLSQGWGINPVLENLTLSISPNR